MTGAEIILAARSAIGTPFKHQGRIPGRGLDCAGLIVHVAKTLGVDHFDRPSYSRLPGNGLLESVLDSQPCISRVVDQRPGDILLMRFRSDPQHLGIFTGETLIHAYQPPGKVCEHQMTEEWQLRVVRIYRFNGVFHGE